MPTYKVSDPTGRTLEVSGATPPNPMQIKALFDRYDAEQDEDPLADERTFGGQLFETAKGIPRGFLGSFLTAGEGLAEIADAATNTIGLEDLIDSGEDNAMVSFARDGRAALQESLGADEAYRDTWMTKFGEGLGSFASFFTPALVAKGVGAAGKLLPTVGAGALAVGSGAGDQAQRIQAARDQGIEVSQEEEDLAIGVFGAGIGFSELAAPTRLLSRLSKNIDPATKIGIKEKLVGALGTGAVEGVQEALATVFQDATERGIYNENLAKSDSLLDDFTVGGAVGTFADLALGGAKGRRRQMGIEAQNENQKNAKEILERERQNLSQEVSSAQAAYEAELAANQEITPITASEVDLGEIEAPRRGEFVGAAGSSGAYLNVVDREGNEFQAEEKTAIRKGKEERYVRRLNDNGTFTNIVLSRDGVPVQGVSSEVILPPPENIPSRRSKDPMLAYARRIRELAGDSFLSAGQFSVKEQTVSDGTQVDGRDVVTSSSFQVEDINGKRYGKPFAANQREEATSLAGNLNEQLSDAGIAQRINTAIDSFNKDRTARFNAAFINAEKGGKENFAFEGKEYSTEENNYNLDLSPEERSTMFAYGWKTLNIDQNTYTSAEVNQAGETTVIEGFDEQMSNEDINNTVPSKLTMSQRINKKRMAKGKTPTNAFTIEEVKGVLKNKLGNLRTGEIETETYKSTTQKDKDGKSARDKNGNTIPIVVSSSGEVITGHVTGLKKGSKGEFKVKPFVNQFDAALFAKKRNEDRNITNVNESVFANKTIRISELNRLLESKNIITKVGSPEFKVLKQAFIGVSKNKQIDDLSNAEMKILYQKIRSLPQFADPIPLVNFLPKKTPVVEAVQEEVVQEEVIPDDQPQLLLPQKTLGQERLEVIQKALDERMNKTGLGDIKATISRTLQRVLRNAEGELVFGVRPRGAGEVGGESFGGSASLILDDAPPSGVEAFYSTPTGEIFLGLDRIDSTLPIEQQVDAALELLDHEQVHAMREANLFTDKEWEILSKAAENTKSDQFPDKTFLRVARDIYGRDGDPNSLSDEGILEEAVAELVRAARKNPKIISGKPKNLIGRIVELFARLKGFITGSGYTNFESLIADIEGGAIGARERGARISQEVAAIVSGTSEGQRTPDFIPEVSEEVGDAVQLNDKYARMGVNVATDGDTNYSDLIVSGQKRFETRDTDSLRPYVGEQVGIVETKKGQKAKLVGYATVGEPQIVDEAGFDALRTEHLVPKGSKFDIKQGQNKYLYEMVNPQKLREPVDVSDTRGIVARNISSTPVLGDKFSKRKASSAAITPFLEGKEEFPDIPKTRGKILKKDVATYLQERALGNIGGQAKDLNNPDDRDSVADDLAEEAIYEANTQASALEWYDKTIDRMIGMMSLKHPEILTDPDKQTGMLVSLAITSQNLDVPTNLQFAESVYKTFDKTGKFPIVGTGKSLKVMKTNFKKANFLIDDLGSVAELRGFLQTKFKVGELNNVLESRLKKFAGTRTVGGENMDTEVYGSAVFGPKVGNGFYTNLRGDFSPVTMDMWFMRTVGRLTGKLLEFEPVKFQKQLDRLAKEEGIEGASEKQLIEIARAKKKQHEKDYKTFRKEFDDGVREKSESVKASESIVKSLTGTIDSPSSGGERNLLRDVVRRAVEKFNTQTGNNIDPASFQALIWYPEQDLYKKLGVSLKHIRQDYASSTKSLLLKEGYSERAISEAENRVRVSAESGSGGVRQDSREFNQQGVEETSLDAGRSLSEQEESPTLTDKFSRRVEDDGLQRDRDRRGIREAGIYEALPGAPNVKGTTGPIPEIVEIAKSYAERNDIPYRRQPEYVKIDVERSTRIADAYDKMPHDPFNSEVQEAYKDLSRQTIAQYEALVDGGYSFTFFGDNTDPYDGKPWRSLADLRNNKTMAVYSTEAGYGMTPITDQMRLENPLLEITPYVWKDQSGNDKPVMVNDLFRAVHDAFGHGSEYAGFRPRGEENAWVAHSQLFTGPALKALTSETRGQNSWLNFGPYGEHNRTASIEDTIFADQKTGVMPSFTWTDGALPPLERERADGSIVGGDPDIQKVTRDAGAVQKVVDQNEKDAVETPADYVPRFSFTADPEAQYVAQNPEEGITPGPTLTDKFSRRNTPELAPTAQATVSRIAGSPQTDATPGETYLESVQSFTGGLSNYLIKIKQETIQNYAKLEILNRDPAFKQNLADTSSIAAALMADRSMGIVASALKSGVAVYQDGMTKVVDFIHINKSGVRKKYKGLVDVMAPLYSNEYNVSLEELAQAYAIAKRADRLRRQGLPVPTEAGDLAVLEAEIAKFKNEDGIPIIEEWYDTWQAYNSKTVDFMKATGIVDNALAKKWIEMSDYIPFYRQGEVAEGENVNLGKDVPQMFKRNMTTAVKLTKLKGSEKAVNVPMLDAITRNLTMAIDSGMKNVAQQRIVRDMIQLGLAEKATPEQRKNKTQHYVVSFKVDGVEQHYSIKDPLIYESMQPIAAPLMGTSFIGGPSKFLREMITRDPGFMFANMMRDTLSAYVTSGSSFIPVIDTVKNINLNFEELERFGVVGGYDFSNDPDDVVRAFGDYSRERGVDVDGKGDSIGIFKKLWNWSGNATTASDAATRKAVYYDVLARTGNEAEAAFQALEVINFSRRGRNAGVRLLTTAIPFLNARFQGLDVLYRGFMGYNSANRENSRKQAVTAALMRGSIITSTTVAYWLMFSDEEEYKQATDEQRDLNWILSLPKSFGVDVPLRIPVPFEVGLLFKTIPERILDTYGVAEVFGKTGQTSQRELGESLKRGIGETLAVNPLGAQIVAPFIEAALNKNFFTGRDIVPFYLSQNRSQGLISRASNTEVSKLLGEAINISPMKIDHVMYGYVGTIGSYLIDAVDEMVFKNPAVLGDKGTAAPTKDFTQLPVMKRFFLNKFSSGDVQDFYDLRKEVQTLSGDLKLMAEEGRMDEYEAVFRARGHLLAMKDSINYTAQRLTKLRKQRQIVERSDLSSDLKRDMIDEIQKEIELAVRITPMLKRQANLPVMKKIGI